MPNATKQHTHTHQAIQFYRLPDLKAKLGVSGSTIWNWIKQEKFPRGIKISENITGWDSQAVERWMAERIAASQANK